MVEGEGFPEVIELDHETFDDCHVWELECGKKAISVVVSDDATATTCIRTVEGLNGLEGSTTALYSQAKEIMRKEAGRLGRAISFTFSTFSPGMKYWATHKGSEVFGWERMKELKGDTNGGSALICTAKVGV